MKIPPSENELQRLAALRQYDVLDTPPDQAFEDLTLLAAQICQTPIALVSLLDQDRQWFKSKIGVSMEETSRDIAFCAHTILHKDEVLEVRDAAEDPRFADSPLVTADPHVRFYAGAPLVSPDGHALGALCVMDRVPRALTAEQLSALRALSRSVMAQLELRRQARVLENEAAERLRVEAKLGEQLGLAQVSRRALLSVLEDEKQTGQNLRESEERFRQLADNIQEVFWMTDPATHQMLYVSPAYEKIWGRTCESLYKSPQSWAAAIHPDDREWVLEAAMLKQGRGDYDEEYRIVRPNKEVRWIQDRAFPVRDGSGVVRRIVGTAEDITARRKIEEQFRQAQKMEGIGQLAGGVAHDFNNILAVIQMQSELLKMRGDLTVEQNEYADEISATVQRAAALTRQLLLFSRREVFQPRDLDLSESITNTVKMFKRILGENIQMQFKLAPQPMFVHADAGMMDQVLMNLTVNARDAMPEGGHLIIETEGVEFDEFSAEQSTQARPGSFVCLSVSDSGSGIPPEVLPKIFEPFFTTKGVGKGTGLGLATVFGIVQQHQGWVNVYSEIGHGTIFRIYLPRLVKTEGSKAEAPALTVLRGGSETILVAEDDPALRVSIRIALSKLGYRILEAPTGAKALAVWKANRTEIRLLLTDLVMPDGMTGKDLAQQILQENPKLKVVYMSGYSAEVVGKGVPLNEGVNFLSKPFQAQKLVQTIRDSLDGARGTLQAES